MSRDSTAFRALSVSIMRGFIRDKASLFFAIVFPLMFLFLFGGVFAGQGQSKVQMIEVGKVSLFDDLTGQARQAFRQTFEVEHSTNAATALAKVRKDDADVAVEMQGDTLVAHFTRTDPVAAGITAGTLRAFVDGANVAASGKPPAYTLDIRAVEDDSLKPIQFYTPGLLGWAVAMSAAFGAAATLNGWRKSKLLRRLQLSPVSTGTIVGARVAVTLAVALGQLVIFLGCGTLFLDLHLTDAWPAAIPLLLVGTLCFMSIGLLSGAVAKTTEGAVNMANFLVLPMSFLSGSFFPLDGAPTWLQILSKCLPLWWLNDGMTDVLVRGQSITAIGLPVLVLLGFAIVVTALAAKLFRWEAD
jgi:ABC-2 type transport system permease protein